MAATVPCSPCCSTPVVSQVPGPEGIQGLPGTNGTNGSGGINAFTTTTNVFTLPAAGSNVTVPATVPVVSTAWMALGQFIFISDGTSEGIFQVVTINDSTHVTLKYIVDPINTQTGNVMGSGAMVTPSGFNGASNGLANPVTVAQGGTGATSAGPAAKNLTTTYRRLGVLIGANFNVTTDQSITGLPTKYIPRRITADNASVSLTTAAGGIYTGAAKTGTVVVPAAQVYTALTASTKWKDLTIDATGGGPTTDILTATTLLFSLTTGQGVPATGDIYIWGEDLS